MVGLGGRTNSAEVFILAESQSEDPTSEATIKQILVVDIALPENHIVDRLEVFPEAKSLHVLADSQLIVVEGTKS